jgi:hypothetical protein
MNTDEMQRCCRKNECLFLRGKKPVKGNLKGKIPVAEIKKPVIP